MIFKNADFKNSSFIAKQNLLLHLSFTNSIFMVKSHSLSALKLFSVM